MVEYVWISIIMLAVFAPFFLLALAATCKKRGQPYGKRYSAKTHTGQTFHSPFNNRQPTRLYHGTSVENALEIYNSGLWLIGSSLPPSIWMTDSLEIAKTYSRLDGAIVEIDVEPEVKLTKQGNGVYIFKVRGAVAGKEYYQIEGIRPVGVLTPQGYPMR